MTDDSLYFQAYAEIYTYPLHCMTTPVFVDSPDSSQVYIQIWDGVRMPICDQVNILTGHEFDV
jgi:hypothetical protein